MRRRRRALTALAVAGTAGLAVVAWQPRWAVGVLARLTPTIVWRVDDVRGRVALSFDDGPSEAHTPRVLDILARHGARATFFLIGSRAEAHPTLVARIRAEGHEIANHYFVNGTILFTPPGEFLHYLDRTEHALRPLGTPKLFRPPGGLIRPSQLRLVEERGYTCVLGSAYPYDPTPPPAGYIRWLVEKNMEPGAIVILHDGIGDPSRTLAALDGILATARSRGLDVVPVGELLR